ncbi:hypothetical protein LZ24_00089 [Desulfobotulus alkaliphilus]|uniref:Uncharacterized protein n=1 Tax=Desulfobotulus alkaliphilus TaxID=622671 RepID=A0A562S794_9BACT|nr:hypothetical protein LZ24_00089 [Desulfobotulus alkaliphilus]
MQENAENPEILPFFLLTPDEGTLCENSDKRRKYADEATKGFCLA